MIKVGSMKPFLGSRLRIGHPLSRGLISYWPMLEGSGKTTYDLSGNGNHGTLYGNTKWTSGKFGNCLSFDGSEDYVDTADIGAVELATVTFSFWGKVNSLTRDNDFITKGEHGLNQPLLIWFDDVVGVSADLGANNTDTISILTYDGTKQHFIAAPTNTISDTSWHHIVAVVNPAIGRLSIFVDGTLRASNVKAWNGIQNTTTLLRLGAPNPLLATADLNGLLDNVMIWKRALSASEVLQLYLDPFCMFRRNP